MSDYTFVIAIELIAAVLFVIAIARKIEPKNIPAHNPLLHPPFMPGEFKQKPLLTEAEQLAYHRLRYALPNHYVFSQVSMGQLIDPTGHRRLHNFRRISQKAADFVICTRDLKVLAVVELDDSTHLRPDRQRADAIKDAALQCAGIPIHRWKPWNLPTAEAVAALFYEFQTPER